MNGDFTRSPLATLGVILLGIVPLRSMADEPITQEVLPPPADRPIDFQTDIQPILDARCVSCHGPEAQKSGLRLDSRDAVLQGGDLGSSIEPGNSAESLVIHKVTGFDNESLMPPSGDPLSDLEIGLLRAWIDQGTQGKPTDSTTPTLRRTSNHWAFQTIQDAEPPSVSGESWVRTPIDAFILDRLDREGVTPSPEADRVTLIRRLSLDLTGIPPTPDEVAAFVEDPAPNAVEALVDRLLGSPHYGERWGRHWLDLARYADSDGYEKDNPRPEAYRFRDWVINSVNSDLPFDQFTMEQLAGDLIPDASLEQRTAAGFHRNTLTNTEGGVDKEEFRVAAVVDRVNTTGTVWLGLTVGCAQCHTHKYDPITQREYYQLFAFFNASDEDNLPLETPSDPSPDESTAEKPNATPNAPDPHVRTFREQPPESRRPTHILIRGDFLRPGETVDPNTFEVLPPLAPEGAVPDRRDLARWLVDPENPLTARVTVNRIWFHLFGRALVPTMDDFGTQGEPPSHPELLDWLASEFQRLGWSQKALIRTIVLSSTYRQASSARPELDDRDPQNVWLARQNRVRLEAEIIRDASLAAAGLLSTKVGGPSVFPPQPSGISDLTYARSARWQESTGEDRYRRGLYTFFRRTSPYPMLTTFDAPDANVCAVGRETSNTPLQALTLLNDAVFVECARALAIRVARESDGDLVTSAFRLVLGRSPFPDERAILETLHQEFLSTFHHDSEAVSMLLGTTSVPDDLDREQVAALTATARVLLNLDEFMTRE
ncbi:PSD1 and planctomycete cytochrome C domain-containing protein [Tautonia rosea]|uniref:PSD1 and planctomycete cytochrome C domain-containing protein n=1 Tax=Tautonia rosea TaxID=2728037 RepID=UPI0019D1408F|nr:PSD1 and planctomycete cytochrome C domain-containing protein [Tautonia rosea]